LAEGLETAGLIQRETDQADRRIVSLSVTRKGAALLQDIEKHRRKLMEAMMEDLSDDELELWLRLQEKMIARFQAETTNSKQE
jgi:DNA-binding MarR family transcriptional regulator